MVKENKIEEKTLEINENKVIEEQDEDSDTSEALAVLSGAFLAIAASGILIGLLFVHIWVSGYSLAEDISAFSESSTSYEEIE